MDRKKAFDYIEVAAHERIMARIKHSTELSFTEVINIKRDIEYYEEVMKYIEENLK